MKSKRTFQLWEYSVSHQQMLIRSPKNEEFSNNHDIVFVGVSYCDLESLLTGIEIRNATKEEVDDTTFKLGRGIQSEDIFILESTNRVNIIVAAAMHVSENQMDIFDSPFEKF